MFTEIKTIGIGRELAENLLGLYQDNQWTTLKEDNSKLLASYADYYIKIFKKNDFFEKMKCLVVGNRSERFIRGNELLAQIGLHTPSVVISGKLNDQPFIIMKAISGWNLSDVVHSYFVQPTAAGLRWKRALLREVGHSLGTMHGKNIVHGDLRASNILLHESAGKLSLYFIDNERTRIAKRVYREKIRNLVQILMMSRRGFTTTDRFRIMSAYFSCNQDQSLNRKKMTLDVLLTLEKRLHKRTKSLDGKLLEDLRAEELFSYTFR
jgi:tRNA A-37 threonylcarbamoyl transferase component Bud32